MRAARDQAIAGSAARPVPQPLILARLKADFPDLPEALARAAKYVINYPASAVSLSIGQLAEVTESGQASIIRLCRHLGFGGFRDFRLALAAQLGTAAHEAVPARVGGALERLRDDMIGSLQATPALLDAAALRQAAERIAERGRANVYGAGVSGLVGAILAAKLLRAGIWAQAFTDPNIALEVMGPASRHAVAIAVSDSGGTPETVRALRAARASGAVTVAITSRPARPLAAYADHLLRTAPLQQQPFGGVTTSLPAQIFAVEALVAAVAEALEARGGGGETAAQAQPAGTSPKPGKGPGRRAGGRAKRLRS